MREESEYTVFVMRKEFMYGGTKRTFWTKKSTYSRDKSSVSVPFRNAIDLPFPFRSVVLRFRCFAVCQRLSVGARDKSGFLWDGVCSCVKAVSPFKTPYSIG